MNWKILALLGALTVAGCAGQSGTSTDDGTGFGSGDGGGEGTGTQTWPDQGGSAGAGIPISDDAEAVIMNERVVYFAFDSADVDDASIALLKQHGAYLAENPGESVRLEGHTDERGSREYNIGLGERRAVSVKSILLVHGAAESQLIPVSFGEERPAELGSDESAWQLNRRVELVYER